MTDTGRLRAALLRLLRETLGVARERRLPASVCGEAASDELLACVLVGFGATGLSTSPSMRPRRWRSSPAAAWRPSRS